MLPKAHRLRYEKDIKALFAKGKGVFDMVCGVKYKKNNLEVSRFAVVVGVKVSKKAVDRNRLKRQLRQVLQDHLGDLKGGYDVVLMVREKALGKTTKELNDHLMVIFSKTPLLLK